MGYWEERHYTIRAGEHFPNLIELPIRGAMNFICPVFGNNDGNYERIMEVTFDPNCAYQLDANTDGLQWNKVGGLTTLFGIHNNSVRFGWRVNNGILEIAPYTYYKGQRYISQAMFRREFNSKSDPATLILGICISDKDIVFGVLDPDSGAMGLSLFDEGIDSLVMYRANPFFGGQTAAPYKMDIKVAELNKDFSSIFNIPKEYLYKI
jgi:hypothetical protein